MVRPQARILHIILVAKLQEDHNHMEGGAEEFHQDIT